jgi:prolyl 4-hydroxylase
MEQQTVTPELRQWIAGRVAAGDAAETVMQAMLDSGWAPEVARAAWADVQASQLDARQPLGGRGPRAGAAPLPELDLLPQATRVLAVDREVDLLVTLQHPRIVVLGGLLSGAECDELVLLARQRLSRSETVQLDTGASEVNTARTSEGMFFDRGENAVCARVEARLAALLDWPVERGEGLQVLRYGVGAEYKPHYDYFDTSQPGTPAILRRGGQRVGTVVMYLNTPERGGATTFPDAGLAVNPVKGNAVFFNYDRPHPATGTLHGGAPVLQGEKWVATKWLRQGRFE